MSLKSRTRTVKKRERQSHFDPLVGQKNAIRTAMLEYLGAAVLFGVVAIVVTIMALINESTTRNTSGVIFAEIVVFVIFVYFLISFVRRFIIFLHFRKMIFSTEQSVFVRCQKISFLLRPLSKFSSAILCMIWIDEYGNKFFYVYPEQSAPSEFSKKYMKEKYIGNKIELICYQNTNMVKRLP